MALRIANNISAMNTQRWLGVADGGMKQSLERLSSGYRINKAADDAAGLAISQAFRADIASFKVASRNTSEAAALLQVAEGGMDQIGNMLTRLKELATQASSANVGQSERDKINSEGAALLSEIDRIANSASYGSTQLLDGSFGTLSSTWDTNMATAGAIATGDGVLDTVNGNRFQFTTDGGLATATFTFSSSVTDLVAQAYTLSTTNAAGTTVALTGGTDGAVYVGARADVTAVTITFDTIGLTIVDSSSDLTTGNLASNAFTVTDSGFSSMTVDSTASEATYTFTDTDGALALSDGTTTQTITSSADGLQTYDFDQLGVTLKVGATYDQDILNFDDLNFTVANSGSSKFQVGAANTSNDQISISVGEVTTGSSGLDISGLDLSTTSGAQTALTTIDTAISSLATTRGDVGAAMNRLAYAAANLSSTIENVQAAESVIRDVDMASEMTEFTKNQILLQAGTAMLAQANMAPQQVLSLFG